MDATNTVGLYTDFPGSSPWHGLPTRRGVPGSIPGGVRNLNIYPGIGCVLSCVVSGEGPDIKLTTDSGRSALLLMSSNLFQSLWIPLHSSDPRTFEL